MTDYAILLHDRETEDDPNTATVIYTSNGTYWHEVVSGHVDWCNEVVDALFYRQHDLQEKQAESSARLLEEIQRSKTVTQLQQPIPQSSRSDIVQRLKSAAQVCEHGVSNYGNDFYPPHTSCNACERLDDATDEINALRNLVTELLPFMMADVKNGLAIGPPPVGHSDNCQDCVWFEESQIWNKRILDGEFNNFLSF